MFNKLRIGKKGENIIFGTFVLLYIGWCVNSPDMNIESLKSVLTIGLSVGIIYGPCRAWYLNGALNFESQYENDQLNGEQVFWTYTGELDAKRLYANGQCIEGCEH